jgi:hypothetical protein
MLNECTIPPTLGRARERPLRPILSPSGANSIVNLKKIGISYGNVEISFFLNSTYEAISYHAHVRAYHPMHLSPHLQCTILPSTGLQCTIQPSTGLQCSASSISG